MKHRAALTDPNPPTPADMAAWQRLFPHDLDCSMEFTKDKRGNVDAIITTTDHSHITSRPVEVPANGKASVVMIYAAGFENLPDRDARDLRPHYFYELLMKRMIYNLARFYGDPEKMVQHVAYFLGVDHLLANPAPPGHYENLRKPKGPGKKWQKVHKPGMVQP